MNIVKRVIEHYNKKRTRYVPHSNWASQVGHPCQRMLVYNRLNWEEKELPDAHVGFIFEDGNIHENAIIRTMEDAGFVLQKRGFPFSIEAINVTGKLDGFISDPTSDAPEDQDVPLEIKSMSTYTYAKMNSVQDMLRSDKAYIRAYPAQLMSYLLGVNKERGIFILKDKNSSQWKQIDVELDYSYAEGIWKKMESVEKFVKAKKYPDRIDDRDTCRFCPFKSKCLPDQDWDAVNVISDSELEDALKNYWKLKPYGAAFKKADEIVKANFKEKPDGDHLIGDFVVTMKTQKTKIYKVPDEIRAQYLDYRVDRKKKVINLTEQESDDE